MLKTEPEPGISILVLGSALPLVLPYAVLERGDSCVEKGREEAAFPTGSLLLLDKEAQPCNLPACF